MDFLDSPKRKNNAGKMAEIYLDRKSLNCLFSV